MKFIKYSFLLVFLLGLASCHKDDESIVEGETTTQSPQVNSTTTGDILGYVYDEQNNPVQGANVTMLKEATTTDQYGVFKFKNVELDQFGTYLQVTKAGFIVGSDMIDALPGEQHTSRVRLLKLDPTGTFAASSGGSIAVEGGGQVVFAPASIVSEDGSPYTGTVRVTAKRLATNDPYLSDMMPGGLLAIDDEGATVTLGSMGMVAVELRDAAGSELNIAPGETAEITFPIADGQQSAAPAEIKLWSFDESQGRWIEEGSAIRSGANYIANVSHFSFWNCDAPFPVVGVCGKILFEDGSPAANVQITMTSNMYGVGYGWTSPSGAYSGKVPKGQVLTVTVYNSLCDGSEAITTTEVGPFDNKTTLDDIVIPLPSEFAFEGIVQCSGSPVPNATVVYSYNGSNYILEAGDDGSFTVQINDNCGDVQQATVFAVDPATGTASSTIAVDPSDDEITLEVCIDCGFTVAIETDTSVDPCQVRQVIAVVDGNGSYTYEWANGSTDASSEVGDFSGQFCVTVTETTLGCEMIQCSTEPGFSPLGGELYSQPACSGELGFINIYVTGGYLPYSYSWSDPSLMTIESPGPTGDSLAYVENVAIGTYMLTVTDAEGCTLVMDVDVENQPGIDVGLSYTSSCGSAQITASVTGGSGSYTYDWGNGSTWQSATFWAGGDGNYCVTVTDQNGCTAQECIDVIVDFTFEDVQVDAFNCSAGTYSLTANSVSGTQIVFFWYAGQSYDLFVGDVIDIDFIPNGFQQLDGYWLDENEQCEGQAFFTNPFLAQVDSSDVTFEYTDTSCAGCTDGSITTNDTYLSYTEWNGANAGAVLVLNADYIDVSAEAAAAQLSAGTYYVVVTDSATGCYIYSDRVILE